MTQKSMKFAKKNPLDQFYAFDYIEGYQSPKIVKIHIASHGITFLLYVSLFALILGLRVEIGVTEPTVPITRSVDRLGKRCDPTHLPIRELLRRTGLKSSVERRNSSVEQNLSPFNC